MIIPDFYISYISWDLRIWAKFEAKCEDFERRSSTYAEQNRNILTKKLAKTVSLIYFPMQLLNAATCALYRATASFWVSIRLLKILIKLLYSATFWL